MTMIFRQWITLVCFLFVSEHGYAATAICNYDAPVGSLQITSHLSCSTGKISSDPSRICTYDYTRLTIILWPNRFPIGERGGLNLCGFVGNNSLKFVDNLGQRVFIDVDENKKIIYLLWLYDYVFDTENSISEEILRETAQRHKKGFIEDFRRSNVRITGNRFTEDLGKLYKDSEFAQGIPIRLHPFHGYKIEPRIQITFSGFHEPSPDQDERYQRLEQELFSAHMLSRMVITSDTSVRELSVASGRVVVFHEYMHKWRLTDEYSQSILSGTDHFSIFNENWGRNPEGDSVMMSDTSQFDGWKIYPRHYDTFFLVGKIEIMREIGGFLHQFTRMKRIKKDSGHLIPRIIQKYNHLFF